MNRGSSPIHLGILVSLSLHQNVYGQLLFLYPFILPPFVGHPSFHLFFFHHMCGSPHNVKGARVLIQSCHFPLSFMSGLRVRYEVEKRKVKERGRRE